MLVFSLSFFVFFFVSKKVQFWTPIIFSLSLSRALEKNPLETQTLIRQTLTPPKIRFIISRRITNRTTRTRTKKKKKKKKTSPLLLSKRRRRRRRRTGDDDAWVHTHTHTHTHKTPLSKRFIWDFSGSRRRRSRPPALMMHRKQPSRRRFWRRERRHQRTRNRHKTTRARGEIARAGADANAGARVSAGKP